MNTKINVTILNPDYLPVYTTKDAAGADLKACITEPINIAPGERQLIPTGISVALPSGYEIQIRPRSGLALKKGITVLNSPGTIDADYRGEVGIILINHGYEVFTVNPGDRIAQMVLSQVEQADFNIVESLDETERGDGGFGHSGVK